MLYLSLLPPPPSPQRESRRLQNQHSREDNSSGQVAEEVRGVSRGLQSLEKRTFRSEDLLHRLEARLTKVVADYDGVRVTVTDLKVGSFNLSRHVPRLFVCFGGCRLERSWPCALSLVVADSIRWIGRG